MVIIPVVGYFAQHLGTVQPILSYLAQNNI